MGNFVRYLAIIVICFFFCSCTSYQPTKNVWKGTKDLWANYVSPPANVDYEDKGELAPQAQSLSTAMIGVDHQLSRLERVMHNSDRPPTLEWMERLFQNFPWVSGFAGVKYDGAILGQEPADSLKNLDFNYLLHEDSKQGSRALRADVQPSELGPEIMLASPLYDGIDFLGLVVTYFDMRQLMGYSEHPDDIVVLCPTALLWPGKYDFASTPLAGVDWSKVVRESSAGICSNANGTFFYLVRYLANLPLVFAVPQKGDFPAGNGGIEQGFAFFPKDRERATPPPVSEERLKREAEAKIKTPVFGASENQEAVQEPEMAQGSMQESASSPNDLQAGSRESVLLRRSASPVNNVEERDLEGENVPVERVQRPRRRPTPELIEPDIGVFPEQPGKNTEIRTPSPFGPTEKEDEDIKRPSPFGPREESPEVTNPDQTETQEERLPIIKRPSPFGPPHDNLKSLTVSQPDSSELQMQENESASDSSSVSTPEPVELPQSVPQTVSEPDSAVKGEAESELQSPEEKSRQQRQPVLLPGGRPSPFGPR